MKLHFEPDLDYQHTAIESVCDLFRGQETCRMVMISSDMRLHWKCSTAVYARSLESQAAAKRPQPPGSSSGFSD